MRKTKSKAPPEDDPFTPIYARIKEGKLAKALTLLLHKDMKSVKEAFRADMNHAWYCVGDIYFKQKDWTAAKEAFKRAVRYRADDEDALHAIGNCYDEQKRPRLAERYFRRALEVDHSISTYSRAAITFNLANVLLDQSRFEEAIGLYRILLKGRSTVRPLAMKNLKLAESLRK